jgi:hypothetical protein
MQVLKLLLLSTALAEPSVKLSESEAKQLFARRVWPVLSEKCLACHGNDVKKVRGNLDLRTREGMLRGGDGGKTVLTPGQAEKSLLYIAASRKDPDLVMPPKESARLSEEQLGWLRQWIDAGAPWPTGSEWRHPDGVRVVTSGGRSADWTTRRYRPEDIWAYQLPRKSPVPEVRDQKSEIRNPIDSFIVSRAQQAGLTQAPEADRRALVRRLFLDLTGLPPTPEEVEGTQTDSEEGWYESLVERLLTSPGFGEQQARHWFDITRYADTSGFSNDFERPHAWRWRDYVVRSFNRDRPFDRFILEQIAGDELAPEDPEALIATGFLRMGPWEHTGMTVAAVTRQQFLDDVTHAVGVTFLGQGLRCASCHDHKFDPIPTKDYYRVQAIFAATQFAERAVPFLPEENVTRFRESRARVEERLKQLKEKQAELKKKSEELIAAYLRERGVRSVEELPADQRPRRDYLGYTHGLTFTDLTLRKVYQKSEAYLERELQRFEPLAFSVYSGPPAQYSSVRLRNPMPSKREGAIPAVRILTGGSLESPAEEVSAGVLSAMPGYRDNLIPGAGEGRRLALARWIASRENPLAARVIVNRIWQQHFGTGLVATPNNLGKMGARPTHHELLDWLATWFVNSGWSIKKLHRLIVTSATYRQAGSHPDMERVKRIDARNALLAYYPARRLAAEELRDAMLAATRELNREMGGPGVFPEINWEVAFQPRHIMGSVAPAYLPSPTPGERNRRTLYAFRYRTLPDPMLEVFNRPGSETSCERRDQTTVTPQVFALFNGEFVHQRALALAAEAERKAASLPGQIATAFRLVLGRNPTLTEREACIAHVEKMREHHRGQTPRPSKLPSVIRRSMVEELTGETVEWEEDLGVLRHYQRDRLPWEVKPETRALAELCLVLLNSNEFLYLR